MNKFLQKVAKLFLGISMAAGVGVAISSGRKASEPVVAASPETIAQGDSDVSGKGTSGGGGNFTVTRDDFKCYFSNAYGASGHIKVYGNSNLQFSAVTGKTVTFKKVVITATSSSYIRTWTASTSSVTVSGSTATWDYSTGASSLQLNMTNGSQARVTSIVVTYTVAAQNVTVTFNANGHGTAPSSQTIQSGGKATQPTAPTATGWTFGGWYKEQACTNAWNFSTDTVSTNTTLWAKWTATTYAISYTLNGGTHGSTHPTSGTYDTAFSVSAPTKTGYTFTGWTVTSGLNTSTAKWGTTSSPSTAISSSSTLCVNGTNDVYFKNINAASTAVTLTANWSINSYTVGGTISDGHLSSTANVNYNAALDITIVPDQDYTYPSSIDSVTMGGAAYAGYTYDSTDGSFSIEHVTGNVVINATCVSTSAIERFFDYDLTNCSIENAPESMYDTEMKVLQIVADDHYKFPSSITVTGISAEKWEYDADEGTILINEPDGNIDITITCVAKAQNIITIRTLTGVTQKSGDPTIVEEDEIVTLTFIASSGYALPTSSGITVTGVDSQSWSWDQNSGELEILGGTSNITVSVVATQRDLTNGSLTLGTKKTSYTTGDDFELPSTVTANFNLAPLTVNVKNDVVVSGPVTKNNDKYVVTGSGTVTLTYTFSTTGKTQSASYDITANSITPSAGGIAKVTNVSDLTVGSTVYLVTEQTTKELSGITDSTYGSGTAYTTNISGLYPLTICTGNTTGSIAFANSSGNYLNWSGSKNTLNTSSTLSNNTSWTVSISNGNATILNVATNTRRIVWNAASSGLRFAAYNSPSVDDTGNSFHNVQLYKNYPAVVKSLKWITAELKSGNYYKGNSVTASDFTVTAHYDDGTSETVTSNISVANGTLNNIGTNDVTLTYGGKSCVVQVTASYAPVTSLTLSPSSASIGLDESYSLSDIDVTVNPSITSQEVAWELYNAGGLVENTDYTFDGDEYHSINEGTVVFRCKSVLDNTKYADFTLTIAGDPIADFAKSSTSGYVGKNETLSFTYGNLDSEDIVIASGNPSYVTIGTISASEGSGTVVINFVGAGSTSVTIGDGSSTLDTITVTVNADSVSSISVKTNPTKTTYTVGETFSATGLVISASMASGDTVDLASNQYNLRNVPTVLNDKGVQTITVELVADTTKTTSFNITVNMPSGLKIVTKTSNNDGGFEATLLTSSNTLSAGMKVAIGSSVKEDLMGTYDTGNNVKPLSGDGITVTYDSTNSKYTFNGTGANAAVYTLGGNSSDGWTFTDSSGNYLYKPTGTNNQMKAASSTDNNILWDISLDAEGVATITNKGNTTNNLMARNKTSDLYSCYASTSTAIVDIELYQVSELDPTYSYNAIDLSETIYDFIRAVYNNSDYYSCQSGGEGSSLTNWSNITSNAKYTALTSADKQNLANAVVSSPDGTKNSSEMVADFLSQYDYVVWKYGKSYDYLGRVDAGTASVKQSINLLSVMMGENTNTVAIVVIISMVSITAIGGYFFLTKRKEN